MRWQPCGRTDRTKLILAFRIFGNAPKKARNNVQAAETWNQLVQEEIQQRALVNTISYFWVGGKKFIDTLSNCEFAPSVPNAQCLLLLSSAFTISQTTYGIPYSYPTQLNLTSVPYVHLQFV